MILLETTYPLNELGTVAKKVLLADPSAKIFLFDGEMGSGKTTLIKEMCKALGSEDNFSSPTFSIVNDYRCNGSAIHHFDLYRLESEEELYDIGFEEYVSSGNYLFIEWPEKAMSFLDENYIRVRIEKPDEDSRKVLVSQGQ